LFEKHPVRGSKFLSYKIFKEVVLMVKNKKHLTLEGTIQIINLSYFMNNETTLRTEETRTNCMNKLISKYGTLPNIIKIELPIVEKTTFPLNLEFIRGLVDGDGSFNVSFRTTRIRIGVNFTVVSELSSISVLNQLIDYFNCGAVYKLPSNAARYQVQTVDDILNNILPKFKGIKFNTYKHYHFETTIKVCEIIKNTGYKTKQELKNIVDLVIFFYKKK
jgi:LAGLIDADG endonuclease